jgi:hypothetical protein
MKFTLCKATFVDAEVEVPTKCPACGASFEGQDSSLIEWDWHDVGGRVDMTAGEPSFPHGMENEGDDYHPCALWCRCGNWSLTP